MSEQKSQVPPLPITDGVREFLLSLIPKESIDKAIEDSWKRLTQPRKVNKGSDYSPRWEEQPSELDEMVMAEMRRTLKDKVRAWGREWQDSEMASDAAQQALSELVNHAAGTFIRNVARNIVDRAVGELTTKFDEVTDDCKGCYRTVVRGTTCTCGRYAS